MDIRPIGSNEIRFPTRIKTNNNSGGMVYEPNDGCSFPPKLKAIVIIPKDSLEVTEDKDGKEE